MKILTDEEKRFLDVFLHEATTPPFTGPATKALHRFGAEYADLSFFAWAYEQEVTRTGIEIGHAAEEAPPIPWTRDSLLRRSREVKTIWEQQRQAASA